MSQAFTESAVEDTAQSWPESLGYREDFTAWPQRRQKCNSSIPEQYAKNAYCYLNMVIVHGRLPYQGRRF
jgi:hypothetical protein